MRVSRVEYDRRVNEFVKALHGHGMRATHQRLEVVRQIAGTDEHPDVETVYREVRKRMPTISLDTVYRTLATLADLGLIERVTSVSGPARFDANTSRHHHFICTRCGGIRDVIDPPLDFARLERRRIEVGTVESVEVQFRGICGSCEREITDLGHAGTAQDQPRHGRDKTSMNMMRGDTA
ncbi:MAG: transcriptional repressor [Coriobacteriia bacterium]|jgi:Fur family peroxide stress response transcriptional regulator|nr:transcriptional repressor [Coriobacteriia bacterium]